MGGAGAAWVGAARKPPLAVCLDDQFWAPKFYNSAFWDTRPGLKTHQKEDIGDQSVYQAVAKVATSNSVVTSALKIRPEAQIDPYKQNGGPLGVDFWALARTPLS